MQEHLQSNFIFEQKMFKEIKKIFEILIQIPILIINKIDSIHCFMICLGQSIKKLFSHLKF